MGFLKLPISVRQNVIEFPKDSSIKNQATAARKQVQLWKANYKQELTHLILYNKKRNKVIIQVIICHKELDQ